MERHDDLKTIADLELVGSAADLIAHATAVLGIHQPCRQPGRPLVNRSWRSIPHAAARWCRSDRQMWPCPAARWALPIAQASVAAGPGGLPQDVQLASALGAVPAGAPSPLEAR